MDKKKQYIGFALQVLAGAVFILSAVLKFISIDAFDIFVYEHRFLPWSLGNLATRLLVGLELFLGLMLILNIYSRFFRWVSLVVLLLFSIYLFSKPYLFPETDENCHCFGDVFQFTRIQSLLKNFLLVILLFFASWVKPWKFGFRKLMAILAGVVCFAVPVILKPTDMISAALYDKTGKVDEQILTFLYDNVRVEPLELTKGRKVLCLYSTNCPYCVRMGQRLSIFLSNEKADINKVKCIFTGASKSVDSFYKKTNLPAIPYASIDPILFTLLTKHSYPVIVLLEDGRVKQAFSYTTFDEKEVRMFLLQ